MCLLKGTYRDKWGRRALKSRIALSKEVDTDRMADYDRWLSEGRHIYGCDVCPHNRFAPISEIEEFSPRPAILRLYTEAIIFTKQEEFSTLFCRSAIKRTKLAGLQRNTTTIHKHQE